MELYNLDADLTPLFYFLLQSKKAKERRDIVDLLLDVIKRNPKFTLPRASLNKLVEELLKVSIFPIPLNIFCRF